MCCLRKEANLHCQTSRKLTLEEFSLSKNILSSTSASTSSNYRNQRYYIYYKGNSVCNPASVNLVEMKMKMYEHYK